MTERRSLKMRTPSTRSNINGGVASPAASINRKHLAGDNNPLKDPAIVSATVVGMADELLTRDASRFQNPLAVLPESEEHPEKSLNLSNTDDCKKVLVTEWRSAPLSANPRSTFFLMNVSILFYSYYTSRGDIITSDKRVSPLTIISGSIFFSNELLIILW